MAGDRGQRGSPSRGGGLWLAAAAVILLGALIGWLASEYGDRLDWSQDGPRLAFLVLLLAGLVAGVALGPRSRHRLGFVVRSIAGWAAIGLILVGGYAYRGELREIWQRIAGELDTSRPIAVDGGARRDGEERALTIRESADGHYYVNARINGSDVRLLVDTGATTTVLSRKHAERAGIFVGPSDFDVRVRTGSGYAQAARVRIEDLEVGEARLGNVSALVMDTPGELSVLGITTLQRFRGYEVRDGVLTIRW